MLYLNMVLLGRRHWAGGEASSRALARIRWSGSSRWSLALFSAHRDARTAGHPRPTPAPSSCTRSSRESTRPDQANPRRPAGADPGVLQPEVPRDFVETKSDLLGLLKEYEARSGGKIRLNLVPTELYSDEAREAEKRFGIEPRRVSSRRPGQADVSRRSSWAWRSPRASRKW